MFPEDRTVTKQKHLKRRIRERMRATGESYTTARLHVLAARPTPRGEAAPAIAAPAIAGPAIAGPALSPVPQLRLRSRVYRRTSGARRAPRGRFLAAAFTVLLTLLVGVFGLIIFEGSDISAVHSGQTSGSSALSVASVGP